MLRIRVGAVQILAHPTAETPRGLFVARDGFEGWDDSGDARRDSIPRPAGHGEFDVPTWQGPRVVSITGHALAGSVAELGHLRSQVTGVGTDGLPVRVVVDHQGQTLWADARRAAKTTFKDAGVRFGLIRAGFLLQLVCVNPRKFGDTNLFGPASSVTAVQYGNFPADPVATVTGAAAGGYTITGPGGRRVVVTRALVAGIPHVIDFASGGLLIGGIRQLGGMSVFQPWQIGPGGLVVMSVSAGSLQVAVADTFI